MLTTMSTIRITFADGEEARISCSDSQTLYEAARQAGVALEHDCLTGGCGLCKATLRAGNVSYENDTSEMGFPKADPDAVLLCQATPTTDQVDVTLHYSRAWLVPEKKRQLKIVSKTRVSETVWDIRCQPEGIRFFNFLAGQYVRVAPSDQTFSRALSPYTVPGSPEIGFLIGEQLGGALSEYVRQNAQPGAIWNVSGPHGTFYRRHTTEPSLYVAGGTGLAPIICMIKAHYQVDANAGPTRLIFGVSRREDLFYLDELRALEREIDRLSVTVVVMPASSNSSGLTRSSPALEPTLISGTVLDALQSNDIGQLGEFGAAYVCGSPGMVETVCARLLEWGIARSRLFFEEYLPA
jgi:benzoate/toluate 1,2-dioxygenase reductase subunit